MKVEYYVCYNITTGKLMEVLENLNKYFSSKIAKDKEFLIKKSVETLSRVYDCGEYIRNEEITTMEKLIEYIKTLDPDTTTIETLNNIRFNLPMRHFSFTINIFSTVDIEDSYTKPDTKGYFKCIHISSSLITNVISGNPKHDELELLKPLGDKLLDVNHKVGRIYEIIEKEKKRWDKINEITKEWEQKVFMQ